MAVIHFEFDVDSDVHPELHATLSGIGSGASRGERFRQLAATGLLWETVRIHGYPVSKALASSDHPGAYAEGAAKRSAPAAEARVLSADFVDLAIDPTQVPMQSSSDSPAAQIVERGVEGAARHFPVLLNVVALDPSLRPIAAPAERHAEPSAVDPIHAADRLQRVTPASPRSDELVDCGDGTTQHVDDTPPVSSIEHRPSTRSRLMRMKERGLFKNG